PGGQLCSLFVRAGPESLYTGRMGISVFELAEVAGIVVAALAAMAGLTVMVARMLRPRDDGAREIAELARLQADAATRLEAMRDLLAGRQAELARMVNERLDSVTHHLGQSM